MTDLNVMMKGVWLASFFCLIIMIEYISYDNILCLKLLYEVYFIDI